MCPEKKIEIIGFGIGVGLNAILVIGFGLLENIYAIYSFC
jgi:hypothetical protein